MPWNLPSPTEGPTRVLPDPDLEWVRNLKPARADDIYNAAGREERGYCFPAAAASSAPAGDGLSLRCFPPAAASSAPGGDGVPRQSQVAEHVSVRAPGNVANLPDVSAEEGRNLMEAVVAEDFPPLLGEDCPPPPSPGQKRMPRMPKKSRKVKFMTHECNDEQCACVARNELEGSFVAEVTASGGELCHLSREPPEQGPITELNAVGQWRQVEENLVRVRAAMDSGALDAVAPPTMAPGVMIQDSAGSKMGQHYGSASGHRIPNLGEQHITGVVPGGAERAMTFQVAEVTRPLLSVGRICDRGNVVTFGSSGGVITDLVTGEETPFVRDGDGMYQLEFWMSAPGFQRPGR